MTEEIKSYTDLDEEYLDYLIKLAFDLDDLEKYQQIMEESEDSSVSVDEKTIELVWQSAQEKAELLRQEKQREHRRNVRKRLIPQALKVVACLLLVFCISAPVVIATSAEIRSKVIQLLVNIDRENNVAHFDFVENPDEAFAVPEGWTGEYFISYIPEKMEVVRILEQIPLIEYRDVSEAATVYRGFSFSEWKEGSGIGAGTEDLKSYIADVNGIPATVLEGYSSDGKFSIIEVTWANDERMFDITCNDMTVDEALAIAGSVRKIIR